MIILSGNDVKQLRNFLNLNQEDFAVKFKLTDRGTVGKLERSKIIPSDIIEKIQNELGMTDNELERLLNELETNNSQKNKGNHMEDINKFLHEQFKDSNAKMNNEINKLDEEKRQLQNELTNSQNTFIDLSRRIDLLGHEFEIYKLQQEQKFTNVISEAKEYADDSVADLESGIITNVKEETTRILAENLQSTEAKGLSGTGEFIINNLIQNTPTILDSIMKLKNMMSNPNGVNDEFGKQGPFNHDFKRNFDGFPNHPFYNPNAEEQNSVRNEAESTPKSDKNGVNNDNFNSKGEQDEKES